MAGKPLFQLNAEAHSSARASYSGIGIIPLRIEHYRRLGIAVIHEAVRGTNYCARLPSICQTHAGSESSIPCVRKLLLTGVTRPESGKDEGTGVISCASIPKSADQSLK